ncbi:uncharacterized protein DS421_3g79400 [Arachis hypogaea]|nr:uncharacterized protein DS421_3g79400 [Arachis hypogaea]
MIHTESLRCCNENPYPTLRRPPSSLFFLVERRRRYRRSYWCRHHCFVLTSPHALLLLLLSSLAPPTKSLQGRRTTRVHHGVGKENNAQRGKKDGVERLSSEHDAERKTENNAGCWAGRRRQKLEKSRDGDFVRREGKGMMVADSNQRRGRENMRIFKINKFTTRAL